MIPSDFNFKEPEIALLLLALPLLFFFYWLLYHYRQKAISQIADAALLSQVLIPRSKSIYWSKCMAFTIAWIAGTLALMQPRGNAHYPSGHAQEKKNEQRLKSQEVILLIDTSSSMDIADSRNGMARFDYAKDIADQLVSSLKGESVSLFGFTSEVTPLSPATMDYLFVRLMLRQMQINEGGVAGTNIVKALQDLHTYVLSLPPGRLKRIILMSDGGDTALDAMPDSEREKTISSLLDLFDNAPSLNLHIDTIGLGSHQGGVVPNVTYQGNPVYSTLEEELLKRIARRGNGLYIEANAMPSPDIADRLALKLQEDAAHAPAIAAMPLTSQTKVVLYDDYYQIPLALAILSLFFAIVWPNTWKKKLPPIALLFLLFSSPSFLSAQQMEADKAARYFEAKEYSKALDLFEVQLKKALTPWQKSVIEYNIGCVLLAQGRLQDAIEAWTEIPITQDSYPLLTRRISTNLAVAHLKQTEQLSLDTIASLEKAHFLLQEALSYTKRAEQEECALQKLEGAQNCTPASDLKDLEEALLSKYADVSRHWLKLQNEAGAQIGSTVSIETAIRHLLQAYQIALIEEPLQEETIRKILDEQKRLLETFSSSATSQDVDSIKLATKNLQLTHKLLHDHMPLAGRFYFEEARYQLTKILQPAKRGLTDSSLSLLERALEEQHHALVLTRLAERARAKVGASEKQKAQIDQLMKHISQAQKKVVTLAEPFLASVYAEQVRDFQEGGSIEEKCQAHPWDEALPLFEEGYFSASQAAYMPSTALQEKTEEVWTKTIALMKKPKSAFKGTCFGGSSTKGAGKESAKPKPEPSQVPMNQILHNVQQMEQEERVPLQGAPAAPKGVERPW